MAGRRGLAELVWHWMGSTTAIVSVGPTLRAAETEVPGLKGATDLTLAELRAAETEAPGLRSGTEL